MLAQKAQLHLPVLEKIDVTSQQYQFAQDTETLCLFSHVPADDGTSIHVPPDAGMQATVKVMIPRIAYVRGKKKYYIAHLGKNNMMSVKISLTNNRTIWRMCR
jgi:hypothetical protein